MKLQRKHDTKGKNIWNTLRFGKHFNPRQLPQLVKVKSEDENLLCHREKAREWNNSLILKFYNM